MHSRHVYIYGQMIILAVRATLCTGRYAVTDLSDRLRRWRQAGGRGSLPLCHHCRLLCPASPVSTSH
jgi:hypothetical protein